MSESSVFMVYPFDLNECMNSMHSMQAIGGSGWTHVSLHFTAEHTEVEIEISSSFSDILVDDVFVLPYGKCTGGSSTTDVVEFGPAYQSVTSFVHARWHIEDLESDIKEFLWAVGTVPGGSQIIP